MSAICAENTNGEVMAYDQLTHQLCQSGTALSDGTPTDFGEILNANLVKVLKSVTDTQRASQDYLDRSRPYISQEYTQREVMEEIMEMARYQQSQDIMVAHTTSGTSGLPPRVAHSHLPHVSMPHARSEGTNATGGVSDVQTPSQDVTEARCAITTTTAVDTDLDEVRPEGSYVLPSIPTSTQSVGLMSTAPVCPSTSHFVAHSSTAGAITISTSTPPPMETITHSHASSGFNTESKLGQRRQQEQEERERLLSMSYIDAYGERKFANLKTSRLLLRNMMDNLGSNSAAGHSARSYYAAENGNAGYGVNFGPLYRVAEVMQDNILATIQHSPLFDAAVRKMWTSICPGVIDVELTQPNPIYSIGGSGGGGGGGSSIYKRRPTPWFSKNVINYTWKTEMQKMFWSVVAVGYCVVTYCPSRMDGGEPVPCVVDPRNVTLYWYTDQNGQRKYFASPRNLPPQDVTGRAYYSNPAARDTTFSYGLQNNAKLSPLTTTSSSTTAHSAAATGASTIGSATPAEVFEACDVFVFDDPIYRTGELTSRGRVIAKFVVDSEEIIHDWRKMCTRQANIPMVTESLPDNPLELMDDPRFKGSRVNTVLSNPISSNMALASAGRGSVAGMAAQQVARSFEQSTYLDLGAHAFQQAVDYRTGVRLLEDAFSQADSNDIRSDMKPILTRYFSDPHGITVVDYADRPWRSRLKLPPGKRLAQVQSADPPTALPEVEQTIISLICAVMGMPRELLIGAANSKARVAASTMAEENLKSQISWWRDRLSCMMERIYWRIYGTEHVAQVVGDFEYVGLQVAACPVIPLMRDFAIEFYFRPACITTTDALELYNSGLLTWSAVVQTAQRQYGFDARDLEPVNRLEVLRVQDMQMQLALSNREQAQGRTGKGKDNGTEDDKSADGRPRTNVTSPSAHDHKQRRHQSDKDIHDHSYNDSRRVSHGTAPCKKPKKEGMETKMPR
jgi:hypothetical protein